MEFDGNIAKLQGTICSLGAQGMLNKSSTLHNVVAALREIISGRPDSDKAKLTFFMVLNTRLLVSEKLKNDDFVGLFTSITPHVEKEYLITYVYHLNIQLQLFEVIENCPGDLGVELLDVIIKKLQEPGFLRSEFGLEHLYQLWQSVFVKICKIDKGLHVNYCLEKFISSFQDIYSLIQKVMTTSMKVQDLQILIGPHLNNFFKAVLFCLKSVRAPNFPENAIYKLSIHLDTNKCDIESPINVCIKVIFDKLCNILDNFTVDMWMTLSECYLDSDSKESAQMIIGGLIYNVLEEVKQFDVPDKVLNCLSSLAINKSDVMAKAGIDEIISNVENNEREWFEALVKHSGFLEKKSVECVISHIHMATVKELTVILSASYEYLCKCEDGDNLNLIKELFLAAFKRTPDCSEWLEKVFERYRPNLLTTAHTDDEVIKAFNQISKDNTMSDRDLMCLCMQSPFDTIKRICQIAVSGSQPIEFVTEILRPLRGPCDVSPFDGFTLLDCVLLEFLQEELSERETQLFSKLVVHLRRQNFLGPSFSNNLLKSLKEFLEFETLEKALMALEIVRALLDASLLDVHGAAFLVFMSQVMEHLTWDLKTFSSTKAEGRDLACRIVALAMSPLKRKFTEGNGFDFRWARGEILKCWEGNQAHFCDLWRGRTWVGSGKFTSFILGLVHDRREAGEFGKSLSAVDQFSEFRESVVLSLYLLLPVLSVQEWNLIFSRLVIVFEYKNSQKSLLDVLDVFASSLHLLSLNLKREDDIYSCYKYCLRNFTRLVQRCRSEMNEASLARTFRRIIRFLVMIDDKERRRCCWEICSPVLVELIDLLKVLNGAEAHGNEIKELLRLVDVTDAAETALKIFH